MYRQGDWLLATGQENPRTNFLGHAMIVGAERTINFPGKYLIYRRFWDEAERQGALACRCHFGRSIIWQNRTLAGLAIDLPDNLLRFVEVVQFDEGYYENWYDALNLGFRVTPIAGSDYPSVKALPGRERFYVQLREPIDYDAWLEGVRRGRTFVTNGPVIHFTVDGKTVGDEIVLERPGTVLIEARVRFDPTRDDVRQLEVIENGTVVQSFARAENSAEIHCRFQHHLNQTSWLAVRASGMKANEQPHPRYKRIGQSTAHSAAVYITLRGAPGLAAHPRAKITAARWIEQLDDLERLLSPGQMHLLIGGMTKSDSVDRELLEDNRDELLARLRTARQWYRNLAR